MFLARLSIFVALGTTLVAAQLISAGDGEVGVNFGGFKASAGLGGLLTGDIGKGGLHAEAGTPFGQAAGAGLGGNIEEDGYSSGGLYAGASAGGGVAAGAGLGGAVAGHSSGGIAASGASAGGGTVVKTIETQKFVQPVASFHVEKTIQAAPVQPVIVEKVAPVTTHIQKQVVAAPVVPEYVEQEIEVQPQTVYVQKYRARRPHFRKHAYLAFNAGANAGVAPAVVAAPETVKVVEKTVVQQPAPVVQKTYIQPAPVVYKSVAPVQGGFLTRFLAGANYGGGGAVAADAGAAKAGTATYTATATVNKNGNLFNDIFNIPIATLSAVNQLVNGIAGGASLGVTKNVQVAGHATGGAGVAAAGGASAGGAVH